jgi:hypothetical protein
LFLDCGSGFQPRFTRSGIYIINVERRLLPRASSQIEKETNERRTSNIERSTSNTVFCHFIKRLGKANPLIENIQFIYGEILKLFVSDFSYALLGPET